VNLFFSFILLLFVSVKLFSQTLIPYNSDFYNFVEANYYNTFDSTYFFSSFKPFIANHHESNYKKIITEFKLSYSNNKNIKLSLYPVSLYKINLNNLNDITSIYGTGLYTKTEYNNKIDLQILYAYYMQILSGRERKLMDSLFLINNINHPYRYCKSSSYMDDLRFSLLYKTSNHINIVIGRGTNFIGEGYRSLILSDNSMPYNYLRIVTSLKKIQYSNLYCQLEHINDATKENNHKYVYNTTRKYASMHYLSVNLTKRINIGLFETVIWTPQRKKNSLEEGIEYFNPVIFYRPVEYSIGSPNNALMGITLNYKPSKLSTIYSQFLIDEFAISHIRNNDGWWANKFAIQLGYKLHNIFGIKNSSLLYEINYIRPFTYSHLQPTQNYAHSGLSLAHPYGANLIENVINVSYQRNRLITNFNNDFIIQGVDDTNQNNGYNLFKPYTTRTKEYDNYTTQGLKQLSIINRFNINYILNKYCNIYATIELINYTTIISNKIKCNQFVNIGIKSNIYNIYNLYY